MVASKQWAHAWESITVVHFGHACIRTRVITAASTLERKERTTATPEFSDEWLSNCIALMILPVHNDVLEYLN